VTPGGARVLAVRVRPGADRDRVIGALFSIGAQAVEERGDALHTELATSVGAATVERAVRAASADADLSVSESPVADWSERLRGAVGAQELGALAIVPPWMAAGRDPARTVVIEPAMAFGTGEHATTRGVVRLLQRVPTRDVRVADLGAGTGVLAIAAAKLGARQAVAIEIDPDATPNAEVNVVANGVSDRVTVIEGDAATLLPLVAPVDLILANILSSVIVELLPVMAESLAPGGSAILSGVLAEEADVLQRVLGERGWLVGDVDREDIWWSAVATRA
jgi:ribosomal protein L11 methyltransferase